MKIHEGAALQHFLRSCDVLNRRVHCHVDALAILREAGLRRSFLRDPGQHELRQVISSWCRRRPPAWQLVDPHPATCSAVPDDHHEGVAEHPEGAHSRRWKLWTGALGGMFAALGLAAWYIRRKHWGKP
jgi:hypothetical protein